MPIIKESLKRSRRLNCVCGWLEWLFDVKVNDWIIQRGWFPNDNFTFPITDFDLFQQHPIAQQEMGEELGSATAFPSPSGMKWCLELKPCSGADLHAPITGGAWDFSKEKGRKSIHFKQSGLFLYWYNDFLLVCVSGCRQGLGKHLDADLGVVVLALHHTWKCTWLHVKASIEACCLLPLFLFSPSPSSRFTEFTWSLLPPPNLFLPAPTQDAGGQIRL